MNASAYKQTLRMYEIDRDRARSLYERRKAEVYNKLPRVRELDIELVRIGLETARGLLSATADMEASRRRISEILEEKKVLMDGTEYPKDYLTNIYTCALCKDTGYIGAQKCVCLKQRLIDKHYSASGLGAAIENENFQSFKFEKYYSDKIEPDIGLSPLENIRKVYSECVNFVTCFGTEFSNLLLYGETGLGKTFLCNCIARDLLDAGISVLYVTAPLMFKKVEDFRFNRSEQDAPDTQSELIYDADLLILDDLGSEFSSIITDTELFSIVNSRFLARKPTVISTNLTLGEFQNAYTERIVSRIIGGYNMLHLFGGDIRGKKKLLEIGGQIYE